MRWHVGDRGRGGGRHGRGDRIAARLRRRPLARDDRRALSALPRTRRLMDSGALRGKVTAGTAPPPAERVVPGPGQESVWDYPRPPRVEPVRERLRGVVARA